MSTMESFLSFFFYSLIYSTHVQAAMQILFFPEFGHPITEFGARAMELVGAQHTVGGGAM